ncbi:thiol-disulfide oxidoreductase DCC family protein [Streptomyces sp. NPDC001380]|uniref:thiol-disulfide oxidoreductase DCC family protein n=1 Tax=Streptomyces sp. NPDC001380 TaxID=3364566 RepID=UPI0036CCC44D
MATRPVLVYDGDCAFCSRCVGLAARLPADPAARGWDAVPFRTADLAGLDARCGGLGLVTARRAGREVLWVTPGGQVYGGAQAVARLLMRAGGVWIVPGALVTLPPVRWAAAGVYRLVARHRHRMPGGTAACALPPRTT